MRIGKKAAMAAASALLVVASVATGAVAGGAGGGDFKCTQSGIPGWGTVTSQYNHPDVRHYATAQGRGRSTVTTNAGTNAVAKIGRTVSSNACYWGKL